MIVHPLLTRFMQERNICSSLFKLSIIFTVRNEIEKKKNQKALKFKQFQWLILLINFNTDKSKYSGNDFEKDFSEQMSNSVYRKTMENLRNKTKFCFSKEI